MKLAILIMATLAAASAMHIFTEEKRDAFADIKRSIGNLKQLMWPNSEEKRDLADAKEKMESVLDEIKKMYKSDSRRGVFVDYATKIQNMINNIKDILSSESSVGKRNLVDLAKKLEKVVGIYHEVKAFATVAYDVYELVVDIKNMFADEKSDEHKDLVDVASRIEEIVKDTAIFLHTESGESSDTVEKRDIGNWDLAHLAKKLKSLVNIYHETRAFATVAYDVYELARDIKDMFADENSEEHKDLVDIAKRIEEIIEDTVIFLHSGSEESPKRDVASWLDQIEKIKAQKVSRRNLVDFATRIEAIFAELKQVFKSSETVEKRALSGALKDAFKTVGSKILDIIDPMIDWAFPL